MAEQFNPFKTGELYDRHMQRWQLEQDIAQPTLDVLETGRHLPKFSDKETANDYAFRRQMCVPLDMCQDAVRIRVDNIFRTAVARDFERSRHKDIIRRLVQDADGEGTSLDTFMQRLLRGYYVSGADVVTQVTSGDGRAVQTRLDERRAGLRPFFTVFGPLQRYDWATNGSGGFLWARYCLGAEPKADELADETPVTWFLTLGRDEWRIWRAQEEQRGDEKVVKAELVQNGPNYLRRPPIIKAYYSESQRPGEGGVPISLISRPSVVAKVAMNVKSQADADLLGAVTRWMFTGTDAPPDTFGPGTLWATQNPESKLMVVQGDVSHIVEKRQWLTLYLLEILRLLKFRGGMGDVEGNPASGVKLALEMTDLTNELRATASFMEDLELEMMRQAVSLLEGREIPPERAAEELGYKATYTRDFILEPVRHMLENIHIFMSRCGSLPQQVPELAREMLRQVRNMIVRDDSPVANVIDEQIAEAYLTVGEEPDQDPTAAHAAEAGMLDSGT